MPPMWPFGPIFPPQSATWPFVGWPPVQKPTIDTATVSNSHNDGLTLAVSHSSVSQVPSSGSQDPLAVSQVPSSGNQGPLTGTQEVEKDLVICLSDLEAQEFSDFDPTVEP